MYFKFDNMKRKQTDFNQNSESKKTRVSYDNFTLSEYIKTNSDNMAHGDLNEIIIKFNKNYSIIDYCIDFDDDELLDIVVNNWEGFTCLFKDKHKEFSSKILEYRAYKCHMYFNIHFASQEKTTKNIMFV